jgi:hypothetical protein
MQKCPAAAGREGASPPEGVDDPCDEGMIEAKVQYKKQDAFYMHSHACA